MPTYPQQRHNMLEGQLRPHRINNPSVLQAFQQVEREKFVAPTALPQAYADATAPISDTRTMLRPHTLAMLVQALQVQPTYNVLVVAGGNGYSAAILAHLAQHVTLLEEDEHLAQQAQLLLAQQANITIVQGNPAQPPQPATLYDAILIDAPVAYVAPTIYATLKPGGLLAAVVCQPSNILLATLFTRHSKGLTSTPLCETTGNVLPMFDAAPSFQFSGQFTAV